MKSIRNDMNSTKYSTNKEGRGKQSNYKISTDYLFDDISSESSIGGRRFLKNPEVRNNENIARNVSPATTEDENTEDLLTPFIARKTSVSLSRYSKEKTNGNKKSHSSDVAKSNTVAKNSVDETLMSEVLVIQENGGKNLNIISVMTFNDKDSPADSIRDIRSESKMTLFDDQLILSVDELMNENSAGCESYQSSNRIEKSYKEKSLSEIEEAIEYEKSQSQYTTLHKSVITPEITHKSSIQSKKEKHFTEETSHTSNDNDNSSGMEEYSDDFENEQETVSSSKECATTPKSLSPKQKEVCNSSTKQNICKTVPTSICSDTSQSELHEKVTHKKRSAKSTVAPRKIDVTVQTMWSGDFAQYKGVPQILSLNRHEDFLPPPPHTTLKMQSIASSLINCKTLETLTTYNPCITALDNLLKQQINLTREFLTTQRNLHETISKAISQCVTNDYTQHERTIEIMLRNYTTE
ncbi:unnamed protein product [Heterobilharzia americana]|nr:unnamed protein product [Heterobilharzia americana]